MEDVVAGFRPLRGRYVWGVRVGDGALLRFELGPPSLAVEEYRTSGGELEREIEPRGRWRFVVPEGRFRLAAGGLEGDEGAEAETLEALAEALEGQALVEAEVTGEELVLRFDLGAELRVGPHPAMPDAVWWVLHGPGGELLRGERGGPAIEA